MSYHSPPKSMYDSDSERDREAPFLPPLMSVLDAYSDNPNSNSPDAMIMDRPAAGNSSGNGNTKKKKKIAKGAKGMGPGSINRATPPSRLKSQDEMGSPRLKMLKAKANDNGGSRGNTTYEQDLVPYTSKSVKQQKSSNQQLQGGGVGLLSSSLEYQAPASLNMLDTDYSFEKAMGSIAQMKMHNYAMKRHQNNAQKLKLLKEVRAFQEDDNKEVLVKQRNKAKEVLCAWKIRYYVELTRLNTMRRVVDNIEVRNIHLEREKERLDTSLEQMKVVSDKQQALINSMTIERAAGATRESNLNAVIEAKNEEIEELEKSLTLKSNALDMALGELGRLEDLNTDLDQRREHMEKELELTRITCQNLVKSNGSKDNSVLDLSNTLSAIQIAHASYEQDQRKRLERNSEEAERLYMHKEDSTAKVNELKVLTMNLEMKNVAAIKLKKLCGRLETKISELESEVDTLKNGTSAEKLVSEALTIERNGLQKLVSELVIKNGQCEAREAQVNEENADIDNKNKKMKKKIKEQMEQLSEYEVKILNAKDEVDYLADENDELGREIECRTMYGEDIEERLRIIAEGAVKSMEYSRFLEDQLFTARKQQKAQSRGTTSGSVRTRTTLQGGTSTVPSRINTAPYIDEEGEDEEDDGYAVGNGNIGENFEENYYSDGPMGDNAADESDGGGGAFSDSPSGRSTTSARSRRQRAGARASMAQPKTSTEIMSQIELNRVKKKMLDQSPKKQNFARVDPSELEKRLLTLVQTLEEKVKNVDTAAQSIMAHSIHAQTHAHPHQQYVGENSIVGIGEAGVTGGALESQIMTGATAGEEGSMDGYNQNGSATYPSLVDMASDKPWSAAYYNRDMGLNLSMKGIKDPVQRREMERANDAIIHTRMENSFLEIQAKLEEVNAELEGQRNQILSLQDIRAKVKSELSAWRKAFKKKNGREPSDKEKLQEVSSLLEEFDRLTLEIQSYKHENLELNSQAVVMHSTLQQIDRDLEDSSRSFTEKYNDSVANYIVPSSTGEARFSPNVQTDFGQYPNAFPSGPPTPSESERFFGGASQAQRIWNKSHGGSAPASGEEDNGRVTNNGSSSSKVMFAAESGTEEGGSGVDSDATNQYEDGGGGAAYSLVDNVSQLTADGASISGGGSLEIAGDINSAGIAAVEMSPSRDADENGSVTSKSSRKKSKSERRESKSRKQSKSGKSKRKKSKRAASISAEGSIDDLSSTDGGGADSGNSGDDSSVGDFDDSLRGTTRASTAPMFESLVEVDEDAVGHTNTLENVDGTENQPFNIPPVVSPLESLERIPSTAALGGLPSVFNTNIEHLLQRARELVVQHATAADAENALRLTSKHHTDSAGKLVPRAVSRGGSSRKSQRSRTLSVEDEMELQKSYKALHGEEDSAEEGSPAGRPTAAAADSESAADSTSSSFKRVERGVADPVDGEVEENKMNASLIAAPALTENQQQQEQDPIPSFEEGDELECNFNGRGRWFSCTVSLARTDGTYDVVFADEEKEKHVEYTRLRLGKKAIAAAAEAERRAATTSAPGSASSSGGLGQRQHQQPLLSPDGNATPAGGGEHQGVQWDDVLGGDGENDFASIPIDDNFNPSGTFKVTPKAQSKKSNRRAATPGNLLPPQQFDDDDDAYIQDVFEALPYNDYPASGGGDDQTLHLDAGVLSIGPDGELVEEYNHYADASSSLPGSATSAMPYTIHEHVSDIGGSVDVYSAARGVLSEEEKRDKDNNMAAASAALKHYPVIAAAAAAATAGLEKPSTAEAESAAMAVAAASKAAAVAQLGLSSKVHKLRVHLMTDNLNKRAAYYKLKGDMEMLLAFYHSQLDEMLVLSTTRDEVRDSIFDWNANFVRLCGFLPEKMDKTRSAVFVSLADAFVEAQAEWAAHRSKTVQTEMAVRNLHSQLERAGLAYEAANMARRGEKTLAPNRRRKDGCHLKYSQDDGSTSVFSAARLTNHAPFYFEPYDVISVASLVIEDPYELFKQLHMFPAPDAEEEEEFVAPAPLPLRDISHSTNKDVAEVKDRLYELSGLQNDITDHASEERGHALAMAGVGDANAGITVDSNHSSRPGSTGSGGTTPVGRFRRGRAVTPEGPRGPPKPAASLTEGITSSSINAMPTSKSIHQQASTAAVGGGGIAALRRPGSADNGQDGGGGGGGTGAGVVMSAKVAARRARQSAGAQDSTDAAMAHHEAKAKADVAAHEQLEMRKKAAAHLAAQTEVYAGDSSKDANAATPAAAAGEFEDVLPDASTGPLAPSASRKNSSNTSNRASARFVSGLFSSFSLNPSGATPAAATTTATTASSNTSNLTPIQQALAAATQAAVGAGGSAATEDMGRSRTVSVDSTAPATPRVVVFDDGVGTDGRPVSANTASLGGGSRSAATTPGNPDDADPFGTKSHDESMNNPSALQDVLGDASAETLNELNKEYNKLKKDLRKWKNSFVDEHGREPMMEDFENLDSAIKRQIARKNQLKMALGDNRRTPSKKNRKNGSAPAGEESTGL